MRECERAGVRDWVVQDQGCGSTGGRVRECGSAGVVFLP